MAGWVRGAVSILLMSMVGLTAPAAAFAQQTGASKAAAEALFNQAQQLAKDGKLADACKKFDASNQLDPAVGTLLHLGDCYEKQGRTASAWAAFREAKTLAEANKDDRVRIADVRVKALEPQVSKLQVNVVQPQPGQALRRDGIELPQASWGAPLPLDAGNHTVESTAPGRKPFRRDIDVSDGGRTYSLDVPELESATATPVPDVSPPPPPTPTPGPVSGGASDQGGLSTVQVVGLVVGGVGVASVLVGSVFGGLAIGSNSDSKDLCRTDTLCSQEGLDLRNDAKTQADVSTATFAIGGALLATGVVLFVVGDTSDEEPAAAAQLRISGALSPLFSGLTVQGAW